MPTLGTTILLFAFIVTAYALAASAVGARRAAARLIASGIGAFYLLTALMGIASGLIVYAFVVGDYRIKYVQRYSDEVQPLFYKLTSYWGGLDGSLMFWVFLLCLFGASAVWVNRERHRELIPYVVAILSGVQLFFLFLLVFHKNPFEIYLAEVPSDGRGLNPLLQNFYMAIHPPSLYTGFVGMTVPYAFGMAALLTGHVDDAWLRAVRRWVMISWFFLSLGLTLGMLWAYEELGWGGQWGWDPVENAGLLPWLTATAFLHSVLVQERRGMLKVWNVTLVIMTFFLTIFGTFMTRTGVVSSVHAFGEDPQLATIFSVFMAILLVFSFGLVLYRLPLLRSRHELDSVISREAAFLVNNWVFLFAALFILFATMFPTLSEAVTGERLTVGPPFFNKWMLPIGLVTLFLTGVGPLLAWRKSTLGNLRHQFLWPVLAALVTATVLFALGFRVWSSGLCFALSAFVIVTIFQEFIRGARVRQQGTGTDWFTALVGLVAKSRRRSGGYIVHVGIVLMFLGFAGEGYKLDELVVLKPGSQTQVGRFTIRQDGIAVSDDGQKQMVTARLAVFENGRQIATMHPARWFFRKHEQEPTTEVAIRRTISEDLYIVMPNYDLQEQSASFEIIVNPLVNWIWIGFGVLALGTGIALLPDRTFAFALSRAPQEAATTATILLLAVFVSPVAGQHVELPTQNVPVVARTPLERDLMGSIVCMCGTCGRKRVGECTCSMANHMREEISGLVKQGKTRDEVLQYYIAKYGSQEPLAMPLDRGFNRLAWAVPYVLGIVGAFGIAIVATRWSRPFRNQTSSDEAAPEMEGRLTDELERLDTES